MIGFVSIKQNAIYLKDKCINYEESDFIKNPNFLINNYPDVLLWLSDAAQRQELTKGRFNTPNDLPIMLIQDWDMFSLIDKLDLQTIINLYSEITHFYPAIKTLRGKNTKIWSGFELIDIDLEFPLNTKVSISDSKSLSTHIDLLELFLWLVQQDITLPKGTPTETKMKLRDLLEPQNQANLSLFVKREQIARILKEQPHLANKHWQSDWIAVAWLKAAIFDDIERNLDWEFDVMAYEETQPVSNLFPKGFNLTWLFCPSAHIVLNAFLQNLYDKSSNNKKLDSRTSLITLLIGLFVFNKLKQVSNHNYLSVEFDLLNWQTIDNNKKGSSPKFSNKYI